MAALYHRTSFFFVLERRIDLPISIIIRFKKLAVRAIRTIEPSIGESERSFCSGGNETEKARMPILSVAEAKRYGFEKGFVLKRDLVKLLNENT